MEENFDNDGDSIMDQLSGHQYKPVYQTLSNVSSEFINSIDDSFEESSIPNQNTESQPELVCITLDSCYMLPVSCPKKI